MRRFLSFMIGSILVIVLSAMATACAGDTELSSVEYFERAGTTFDGATDRLRTLSADYQEKMAGGRVPLEASGGVTLDTIRAIAETGVDCISVGAITHSAPAVDVGIDLAGD